MLLRAAEVAEALLASLLFSRCIFCTFSLLFSSYILYLFFSFVANTVGAQAHLRSFGANLGKDAECVLLLLLPPPPPPLLRQSVLPVAVVSQLSFTVLALAMQRPRYPRAARRSALRRRAP